MVQFDQMPIAASVGHVLIVVSMVAVALLILTYWFLSHLERQGTSLSDFTMEYVLAPILLALIVALLLVSTAGLIVAFVKLWRAT